MQKASLAIVAALLGGIAVAAYAQAVKPDRAIKYRQGILQAQSWNAGIMNAMVKGEQPYDKEVFLKHAIYLDQLSHMAWEGFAPGTDQGAPTKAKPEIWMDMAKFNEYADKLQAETPKLVTAARTGDMGLIKPAFGNVGKACSNCHDDFRYK